MLTENINFDPRSLKQYNFTAPPINPRKCKQCGVEFMPKTRGQLYCDDCRKERAELSSRKFGKC